MHTNTTHSTPPAVPSPLDDHTALGPGDQPHHGARETGALRPDVRRLRTTLRLNAATSGAGGVVAALAAGPVAEMLGVEQTAIVRLVGLALVGFAAAVIVTASTGPSRLARLVPEITILDALWVVASVGTVLLGWFSATGAAVVLAVAAMVGGFAIGQTRALRRIRSIHP